MTLISRAGYLIRSTHAFSHNAGAYPLLGSAIAAGRMLTSSGLLMAGGGLALLMKIGSCCDCIRNSRHGQKIADFEAKLAQFNIFAAKEFGLGLLELIPGVKLAAATHFRNQAPLDDAQKIGIINAETAEEIKALSEKIHQSMNYWGDTTLISTPIGGVRILSNIGLAANNIVFSIAHRALACCKKDADLHMSQSKQYAWMLVDNIKGSLQGIAEVVGIKGVLFISYAVLKTDR